MGNVLLTQLFGPYLLLQHNRYKQSAESRMTLWDFIVADIVSTFGSVRGLLSRTFFLGAFNYTVLVVWFLGIPLIPVARETVILNSQFMFVFVLSILVLKESPSWLKFLAVVCCAGGVILTVFGSDHDVEHGITTSTMFFSCGDRHACNLVGDAIIMFSAVLWACYAVHPSQLNTACPVSYVVTWSA